MGWVSGIAVYVVIWWLVIFMVLPWGVKPVSTAEVARGHAAGAPERPRMWRKLLVTSLIALVLWGIVYWVMESDLIRLDGP
jgi:predicted secreted protein